MVMDRATEFITHFIGVFHLAVEEERLRDVYEKFKALQRADPEHGQLLNVNVNVNAPYTLGDFTASLNVPTFGFVPNHPFFLGAEPYQPLYLPFQTIDYLAPPPGPAPFYTWPPLDQDGRPILVLEPASSVVSVAFQFNWITDNDLMSFSGTHAFIAPDTYFEQLDTLVWLTASIDGVDFGDLPSLDQSVADYAMRLDGVIDNMDAAPLTGLTVTIIHGTDAAGQFENGQSVTELSILSDLMPEYLQPEEPEDPEPENAGQLPSDPALDIFGVDPGHTVVAGANTLANEVFINISWLDAPVVSVMGDVIDLEAISQTNVLVSHQHATGGTQTAPSHTLNMAGIVHLSSQPAETETGGEVEGNTSFPSNWVVARVEADIVAVNWVQQFSFATDFDRAEIQFTGSETFIGLGENLVFNAAILGELGYGYDLIIVGGNMISVTMVNQLNVLLEEDHITYSGPFAPDIEGGDNLLANNAVLTTIGVDSYTDMQAPFEAATQSLADGAENISSDLAQQSVFEGTEVLRVLYIEGDLTTLNLIEQTNVLGDSDQVHLALENFETSTGTEATVISGSNALINRTSVTEYGTDSTVLVGGDVYSDALIYQADLIDTDADPLGVTVNDLASEAVAFLADGMIEGEQPEVLVPEPSLLNGSTSPDVMQTMLA